MPGDSEHSPGNPVGIPCKRSPLWRCVTFTTPLTGPRWGPPSESANACFSPGETAVRPLLGCMTGPLQGPGEHVGLMDPSAQKDQGTSHLSRPSSSAPRQRGPIMNQRNIERRRGASAKWPSRSAEMSERLALAGRLFGVLGRLSLRSHQLQDSPKTRRVRRSNTGAWQTGTILGHCSLFIEHS